MFCLHIPLRRARDEVALKARFQWLDEHLKSKCANLWLCLAPTFTNAKTKLLWFLPRRSLEDPYHQSENHLDWKVSPGLPGGLVRGSGREFKSKFSKNSPKRLEETGSAKVPRERIRFQIKLWESSRKFCIGKVEDLEELQNDHTFQPTAPSTCSFPELDNGFVPWPHVLRWHLVVVTSNQVGLFPYTAKEVWAKINLEDVEVRQFVLRRRGGKWVECSEGGSLIF